MQLQTVPCHFVDMKGSNVFDTSQHSAPVRMDLNKEDGPVLLFLLLTLFCVYCCVIVWLWSAEEQESAGIHRGFGMVSAAVPPPGVW